MEALPDGLESYRRWYEYSRARDMMLKATDIDYAMAHCEIGR
jgi:polyphosphate kinase 2 (PPK2 family)